MSLGWALLIQINRYQANWVSLGEDRGDGPAMTNYGYLKQTPIPVMHIETTTKRVQLSTQLKNVILRYNKKKIKLHLSINCKLDQTV